jgi:predicted metalloprotease
MNTAVEVVNAYWAKHWSDFFTETYVPPKVVGLYDGSMPGAPTCAGKTLESYNAHYCKVGHFVAWDLGLMSQGLVYGDGWVYLAVAHEWGHAIQAQLSTELRSVGTELQADCLAGATLVGAAKDGTLKFEAGDAEEIANGLAALADDTPWTRVGDHGNAQQRIRSFAAGSSRSVPACLPISRR